MPARIPQLHGTSSRKEACRSSQNELPRKVRERCDSRLRIGIGGKEAGRRGEDKLPRQVCQGRCRPIDRSSADVGFGFCHDEGKITGVRFGTRGEGTMTILADKTVLVTGAGAGIGRAIALM